jgi:hypothetical protein
MTSVVFDDVRVDPTHEKWFLASFSESMIIVSFSLPRHNNRNFDELRGRSGPLLLDVWRKRCQNATLKTAWRVSAAAIASYIANEPRPTNARPENKPEIPDQPIIINVGINKTP